MVPAFNPASCPNLAIPAEVMRHIVQIESGANPFAIGVVGGRLERQPRSLGEAVATARMLEAKGYDYSVGIAQVNRSNLARYGLDTFERAFDGCANLTVGARILAECYGRSHGDWGKAFSCYYSGNFTTGFRDGYVQRVYDAINADAIASAPITVYPQTRERIRGSGAALHGRPARPGTAAYRISMRSEAFDRAVAATISTIAGATPPKEREANSPRPASETAGSALPESRDSSAFVPRVSGPEGPSPMDPRATARQTTPHKEASDDSFVF